MRAVNTAWGMGVAACVAIGLSLLLASGAIAAPACRVANAATGQSYGTLQEAVNAVPERGEATLSVRGTCYGDTEINAFQTLTIVGRGNATLNGANSAQSPGSVLSVGPFSGPVAITNLTITGGYISLLGNEPEGGAGIFNIEGEVTLNNSTVTGNTGGGIGNGIASITLNNSRVTGNTSRGNGGGIWNGIGHVTLNNSTVTRNTSSGCGGGLFNGFFGDIIVLNDSSVTRNTAAGNGGGICAAARHLEGPELIILNGSSSVSRNTASGNGGGIYNENTLMLNDSSSVTQNVASGKGGGIFNAPRATLTFGTGWNGTISRNIPDNIFNA